MTETKTNIMDTMPMNQLIRKLAVPSIIAEIVNLLYNIVDRIYIGHIPEVGSLALTGVGLFMPLLLLINATAALVCAGGSPLAAIAMGKHDQEKAEDILNNCFQLILILALCITVIFYIFAPSMLRFFGASDATLPYALSYSRIYILGSVFVMIDYGMNMFITAQGFARTAMLSIMLGAVTNIILDPILIFRFNMGVKGAAIATDISQVISSIWIISFLRGKKTGIQLNAKTRPDKAEYMPCIKLGFSSCIMISTEGLLSICFNHSLAKYGGDLAVGAMTIITSLNNLITMPLQGLAQGASPIISYNFGANNPKRVKEAFHGMLRIAVIYTVVFWALVQFFPGTLAGIFTSDQELISFAVPYMKVYFAVVFTVAFQAICQRCFVSLGQAKTSIFLACLRKLILLIPLIFILPLFINNKVFAVFLAEPISDLIAAIITTWTLYSNIDSILKTA